MRRSLTFRCVAYCAIVLIADPRLAFAARSAGIDVSHYQGTLTQTNWNDIHADGKDFGWTKATEGLSAANNDSTFVNNMNRGTNAGVMMGAYHYAHPESNSADNEADHFMQVAGAYLGPGYLRPMLDIEGSSFNLNQTDLSNWINEFCSHLTATYPNADPLIYIKHSRTVSEVNSNVATAHQLDVASYGQNLVDPPVPTGSPGNTGQWNPNWSFWQYGSQGRVNGIGGGAANVDLDVANGDINFVKTYLIGPPPVTSFERFDVNGNTAGSGVADGGSYTWEAAKFSSTSAGTNATAWHEGNFLRMVAGTDAGTNNYTITANSNHQFAGMYLQAGGGGTVNINGPGVLTFTSGDQGIYVDGSPTASSQNLYINAVLSGSSKMVWQGNGGGGGGSLFLMGHNTWTGGTALNTGSGLNFKYDDSFGTGRITWGYDANAGTQFVIANNLSTGPVNLDNPMTTKAGCSLVYVGPAAAPVTFSGDWTMPTGTSTLIIGNASHTSSKMIINGDIGQSGGTSALTKDGVGTLVLSGSNTYTGATTITAGKLQLDDGGKLSTSSAITNNANLAFNHTDTVTQGTDFSGSAITGTGTLMQVGSGGTLILTASNTYTGATTISAGTLQLGNNGTGGKLSTSSAITNNGNLTFKQTDTVTQGTDFSGSAITGTGSLTQAGGGTLVLNATNTYSGKTFINAGTISVGADANLGTAPGSVVADKLTINGGTFKNAAAFTLNSNRGITLASNGGKIDTASANLTYNGVITGTGGLTKLNANSLILGGASNYTGTTTISGGTLQLGSGGITGSLPTTGAIVNNGNLNINRVNAVTQGIDFSGSPITGSGSLTQAGAGGLTLNAANTYSGGTTVNDGTLSVLGASATVGAGNVTVQNTSAVVALLSIPTGVLSAISDTATLSLAGGGTAGVADQSYALLGDSVNEFVGALILGGVNEPAGTYGSSQSSAMFKNDDYFSGTGMVSVGLSGMAGDFNNDWSANALDYLSWRKNVGDPAGTLPNDGSGDPIGDTQYAQWRGDFGTYDTSSSPLLDQQAVPEPGTMLLALFGGAAAIVLCGRRRMSAA